MKQTLNKLEAQLQEMEQKTAFLESMDPKVSKVPVSWHLAHSLKVINSVIAGLSNSDPADYRKKFSWKKELVYLTGKIPRGKARAPKLVVPEAHLSREDVLERLEKARRGIYQINTLPKNSFFKHPFFGDITRDQTARFLEIHTEHHLKIVRDILK